MNRWAPHIYRIEAAKKGLTEQTTQNALTIAERQQNLGNPAVLSLGHFSKLSGVRYSYLRKVIGRSIDPYRVFTIKKRRGGRRIICVPDPYMLAIQSWIHKNILLHQPHNPASYAYHRGARIVECARRHCGAEWLIKIDIENFFESISEIDIYRVFSRLGYEPLVAFELSRLTTRRPERAQKHSRSHWQVHAPENYLIDQYRVWELGHLPQGAPSSPLLANLAVDELDSRIAEIARPSSLVYTRYCDDLVLSTGDAAFSRANAASIIRDVFQLLSAYGFRPNVTKTRIVPPGARKVVLGLLVHDKTPHLTREFRDRLAMHVYYIKKFGPSRHAERRRFHSVGSLRRHIEGLIHFAASIDWDYAEQIRAQLSSVDWPV